MSVYFVIPEVPVSANTLAYRHWRKRHAEAKRWSNLVLYGCSVAKVKKPKAPIPPCRLRITMWRKKRQDLDNAYASTKHLIDALRRQRLIRDDDPDSLVDLHVEERVSKDQKTAIKIDYLEDSL